MMRIPTLLSILLLAVLALGRVIHPHVPSLELSAYNVDSSSANSDSFRINGSTPLAGKDPQFNTLGAEQSKFTEDQRETIWNNAVCRGEKLRRAMMLEEDDARKLLTWPHVQSDWDGDLKEEIKEWGYSESDQVAGGNLDNECNFSVAHTLTSAFKELGIDTRPAGMGGPNRCYQFKHRDGPTVIRGSGGKLPPVTEQYYEADGKKYRITDAFSKIGINSKDGLIAFIHRTSPKYAAKDTWDRESVTDAELPKLRATSDLAWGMWYRETTEENRKNIKHFMAVSVVNTETQVVVSRALELEDPEDVESTPLWPGKEFTFNNSEDASGELTGAAYALLGSNNGMAAAYFLIQHRRQLGPKSIWKMRVFMSDTSSMGTPNILFYVDNREHNPPITDPIQNPGLTNPEKPDQQASTERFIRRHKTKKIALGEL